MRTGLIGAACAVLVLSACGSSGSSNATTTSTLSPATTTTGAPAPGSTVKPVDPGLVGNTLLDLDAPGGFSTQCEKAKPGAANYPPWAVHPTAVVVCAPSSLSGGAAFGLIFANDDDLHQNLVTFNSTASVIATNADTTCPPSSGAPYGIVVGGGKGGSNSVLQCGRFPRDNRPAIEWTNVTNHELWVMEGPAGMSTADALAWWHANVR